MPNCAQTLLRCTAVGALLWLAACQASEEQVAQPDQRASAPSEITGNQADPALTSALEDPILTDPALSQQSNRNAVRAANEPVQAQYPTGMGGPVRQAQIQPQARVPAAAPARVQTVSAGHREMTRLAGGQGELCGAPLKSDMAFSRRLPAAFPAPPGARVTDAAGNNVGGCRGRVIAFTSNAAPERLIEWYQQRAQRAGYSAEHQREQDDYILAGANGDAAYYVIVTPRSRGGSDIALIANRGG
jgi:hypothetical protein